MIHWTVLTKMPVKGRRIRVLKTLKIVWALAICLDGLSGDKETDIAHNKLIKGKIKATPTILKKRWTKAVCLAALPKDKDDIIAVMQVPIFIPSIMDTAE